MIIEFDTKGDVLEGFPSVDVEFSVNFEHTSDGAGEYQRDITEYEVVIDSINIIDIDAGTTVSDDVQDQMQTWTIDDDGKTKSFFDIIHERCMNDVSNCMGSYLDD